MSDSKTLSISRRNALRGAAVATAASFAAPAIASATNLLTGSDGLRRYRGRFVLPGGREITGYFVAPRGRDKLDTVVVLHGDQGLDSRAEATANYFAASGKIAIVPDQRASRGVSPAELRKLAPKFGKLVAANGSVEYVAA